MELVLLPDKTVAELPIHHIDADGACCFRALSYFLYGDEQFHSIVRLKLVEYVASHWKVYQERSIGEDGKRYLDHEAYQTAMSRQYTYGSACEIQATSKVYPGNRFKIYPEQAHVISFNEGASQKLRFSDTANEEHYDVYTNSAHRFSPRPPTPKATVIEIYYIYSYNCNTLYKFTRKQCQKK